MTDISSDLPNHPPAPIALLPGEGTRRIRSGDVDIHVREWGDPDAPAMVLLHGLRGYSGTWRRLAESFADRWRMIAFDARGRGDSDWDAGRNYYTDAYLSDLEAVVDGLGLGRFVLVGHSMGGTTSYVYAAHHPDRLDALVVEDITAGSSVGGAGFERIVAEMAALPTRFAGWAEARAYWRKLRPGVADSAIEERLFKPFETTKASGMGIGVYESQQYVAGLGGRIVVQSREGAGTHVRVLIPSAENTGGAGRSLDEAA